MIIYLFKLFPNSCFKKHLKWLGYWTYFNSFWMTRYHHHEVISCRAVYNSVTPLAPTSRSLIPLLVSLSSLSYWNLVACYVTSSKIYSTSFLALPYLFGKTHPWLSLIFHRLCATTFVAMAGKTNADCDHRVHGGPYGCPTILLHCSNSFTLLFC